MATAKEEILTRIRNAHQLSHSPTSVEPIREYRTESPLNRDELRKMLVGRLVDYKATVKEVSSADLAEAIASVLQEHNAHEVRYAQGLDSALFALFDGTALPDGVTVDPRTLNDVDAVVTSSVVTSAQTGTICLQSEAGAGKCGRRALSLVPDRHLCIVHMDSVVYGVPEMFAKLDPELPTTLISGPSATSDIELVRVEGVHGPRDLIVFVVD
ncbi:LutC/YkgG family protein [Corynebacterium tuscaniense]|uniref:LutC/YkgG family protein n=1 Tax=Corynebacterium tuscaniense TaxID=302449 RepID=UPI00123A45AC|nr:LUD domain-containing protein [Corynebacterium tuscaniense]KAA8740345.1 lactate utilization protein C [Corynebacterium tuscaniense]